MILQNGIFQVNQPSVPETIHGEQSAASVSTVRDCVSLPEPAQTQHAVSSMTALGPVSAPEVNVQQQEREPILASHNCSGEKHSASTENTVTLNANDFTMLLQSMLRPTTHGISYDKNIIPSFDPTQKNQKIEIWIAKVNECAKIYKWSDEQTSHFALPKLSGHAQKWYEGLQTILLTWPEWQERLIKAFPSESNYGALLSDMLDRRMKMGDSIDSYYFEKMSLLNACDIKGKRAVDCLIFGIDDRMIRSSASSARLNDPEDVLKFLKDLGRESDFRFNKHKNNFSNSKEMYCNKCNKTGHRSAQCRSVITEITCFNCKEKGHTFQKCSKPIVKCDSCNRIGHKSSDCFQNKSKETFQNKSTSNLKNFEKRTLLTRSNKTDAKFRKEALINDNIKIECYIDFGSDCTLVSREVVEQNSLPKFEDNLPTIRGFGNNVCTPLGRTQIKLTLGEVTALIDAYIVEASMLSEPLLVGQNFTERPEVVVIKTNHQLDILKQNVPTEFSHLPINDNNDKIVLRIMTNSIVNNLEFVDCMHTDKATCDILVENSIRNTGQTDYGILGGVYHLDEGKCTIGVQNFSHKTINFHKGTVLVRANTIVDPGRDNKIEFLDCNRISNKSNLSPIDPNDININKKLSQTQRDSIVNLVNKYRPCFAQELSELGCTSLTEMNIELNDNSPVVHRPYRLSYSERQIVRDMVQELVANDIAEESSSSYASPIILVTKKTGGYRMCVDFRSLNSKTKKDHFPMPRIDDQLDMLNGSKYFTSLDLASGYYQIPLNPNCKHLTAFITPDGLYQFKKMPFGLVNSPAVFQRTINKVLGNTRFNSALAYMDDILIPGKSFDEELYRLEETFKLLQEAGLTLNLKKCHFFKDNLEYLGYEIGEDGIRPGQAKITAVEQFPTPRNVHEVRQFIGLASYFRKFIEHFATIARPLTDLTRKECVWHWGSDQENAFRKLKEALIQRPLLGIYDPGNETFLHTDASKYGLAGILMQKSDSGLMKPIAYFSRKTTLDEQKYHAYELETLAAIASLQRFRVYLLGLKFTLVTDCNALRATFTKRDLIPRIARWWIAIQEYNFNIQYKPGHTMSHVDALSRNPQPGETEHNTDFIPSILKITHEDWLVSLQLKDSNIQHIRSLLESEEYAEVKKNYKIKNNRLFRLVNNELKWVVPKSARFQLCKLNHDDIGHFSIEKTLDKIQKDFWFPKMKRFIKKYVRSCLECAFSKEPTGPKEGYLHPIHKVNRPFDTVHVDHLGPFVKSTKGKAYLLVLVDGYTKFCLLKPLQNLKSSLTIRALDDVFSIFGYPNRLISDQGSSFTARDFKKFCEESKIKHILNAVASPRANGQVERYNRTILDALTAYTDKLGEKLWDSVLGKLQWGMNNTLNKGIGKTPSEALFGVQSVSKGDNVFSDILNDIRQSNSIEDIRDKIDTHIEKDQQLQKLRYDKKRTKARIYSEGDLVKLLKPTPSNDGKSKKLLPKYTGPFRITKVLDNDRYEVASIVGTNIAKKNYSNIWAADRIKPWITTYSDHNSDSNSNSEQSHSE